MGLLYRADPLRTPRVSVYSALARHPGNRIRTTSRVPQRLGRRPPTIPSGYAGPRGAMNTNIAPRPKHVRSLCNGGPEPPLRSTGDLLGQDGGPSLSRQAPIPTDPPDWGELHSPAGRWTGPPIPSIKTPEEEDTKRLSTEIPASLRTVSHGVNGSHRQPGPTVGVTPDPEAAPAYCQNRSRTTDRPPPLCP